MLTVSNVWAKNMNKGRALHRKVVEELTKFEMTMEELRLVNNVSKDLKNYRKMIRIKKYD